MPRSLWWTFAWLIATFLMLHAGSLPPRKPSSPRSPVVRRTRLRRFAHQRLAVTSLG
ncbi:MAG: hypothetical protein AB1Z22_02175 [Synechococcaceae cyanobacterium]